MGKLETPLTWALVILILGYFMAENCCKVEVNDQKNNGFSWSSASDKVTEDVKITTEDIVLNVDSIIEAHIHQVIDSSISESEAKDLE